MKFFILQAFVSVPTVNAKYIVGFHFHYQAWPEIAPIDAVTAKLTTNSKLVSYDSRCENHTENYLNNDNSSHLSNYLHAPIWRIVCFFILRIYENINIHEINVIIY